jgi:DNA-binding Lrp family transcriptional regulator
MSTVSSLDPTDARLLNALEQEPRASVMLLAEQLGLARNTVHSRLRRLESSGALGAGQRIRPADLGYPVTAFVTFVVDQADLTAVVRALAEVPEVIEAFATAGEGDLLCRVVARSADELYDVVQRLVQIPGVERSSTALGLRELLPWRVSPLLDRLVDPPGTPWSCNPSG